jgi:hypothetical protein
MLQKFYSIKKDGRMIQNGDRVSFILAALESFSTRKTEIYIYFRIFVSVQFLDILIKEI